MPHTEILGSLEAKDRTTDQWGRETDGFRSSVPAPSSPQDHDTVEGQQYWDPRQVRLSAAEVIHCWQCCLIPHLFVCWHVRRNREQQACHQGDLLCMKWSLERWKKVTVVFVVSAELKFSVEKSYLCTLFKTSSQAFLLVHFAFIFFALLL